MQLKKTGKTLLCNTSKIPDNKLRIIMAVIEARHKEVEKLRTKRLLRSDIIAE